MSDAQTPADAPAEPPAEPPDQDRSGGGRRVRVAAGVVVALLVGLLGFAIAVQLHANSGSDNLANLREDDLVGILDDQNARADRLRQQIAELQTELNRLHDSGDRTAAARQQARAEARSLGVLLGTLPARGPGVSVDIGDPGGKLGPEDLLDVVEELRGAGAEAIAFGSVRVSTDTAFTGADGAVDVDGTQLHAPYLVQAIGNAKTLDTALNIPGGFADAVRTAGGSVRVRELPEVTITVTRPLPQPAFASPSGH